MEEITLDQVARDAGVTVQTVIRRFGGKEGLLAAAADRLGREVQARRANARPGDWNGHVRAVARDYEISGDFVLRMLAQEERWPALKPVLDIGRVSHRADVEKAYAPWIASSSTPGRLTAALVVATDVFTWRLLRRDQQLEAEDAELTMLDIVRGLLGEAPYPAPRGATTALQGDDL